jgi:hypothetical protein
VNSASYFEVLLKLRDAIPENVQANCQELSSSIMKMPYPIQAKQPRRDFKNNSGNLLNIGLTVQTWSLVDFHVFGQL